MLLLLHCSITIIIIRYILFSFAVRRRVVLGGGWKGKENERWAFFWNYEGGAVSYVGGGGSFLLRGGIMRIVLLALFGHKLLVFFWRLWLVRKV